MSDPTPSSDAMPPWAANAFLATIILAFTAVVAPAIIRPREFHHHIHVDGQAYYPQQEQPSKFSKPSKIGKFSDAPYYNDATLVKPVK